MGFKMKGSAFKQGNVATKSALKQLTNEERAANLAHAAKQKWWKNEDGTANIDLLNKRGFSWDEVGGRWVNDEKGGIGPAQWTEGWDPRGEQRRHAVSTDLAEEGKRLLTEKEQYKEE